MVGFIGGAGARWVIGWSRVRRYLGDGLDNAVEVLWNRCTIERKLLAE